MSRQPKMLEAVLQNTVREMCARFKLRCYHVYDSRKSEPGFPDLTIVGCGGHMFRELKTDVGRLTAAQQGWLDDLSAHGADAGVWRPVDLASGRIERELRALSDASRAAGRNAPSSPPEARSVLMARAETLISKGRS